MIEFVRSRRIAAPPERIWPFVDDVFETFVERLAKLTETPT
jgi:ligand-binding SRPBCC domain-containing protein